MSTDFSKKTRKSMTMEEMIMRFNSFDPQGEADLLARILKECCKGKVYLPPISNLAEAIHFNYMSDMLCYSTDCQTTLDEFVEAFGIEELVSELVRRDMEFLNTL